MKFLAGWMIAAGLGGMAAASWALEKYVTPTGAGSLSGADWENAYGSVQVAVDACVGEPSTLYLKSGIYSNATQVAISNAVHLTLKGGYAGNAVGGLPGESTNESTVLARQTNVAMRIIYGTNSTIMLDSVTISNGFRTNDMLGFGLQLIDCTTLLTNCVVTRNGRFGSAVSYAYGMGFNVNKGSLTLVDCLIADNGMVGGDSNTRNVDGGAIYAVNATSLFERVRFERNRASVYNYSYGGCLFISGGRLTMRGCRFTGNNNYGAMGTAHPFHASGVYYFSNLAALMLSNCLFTRETSGCTEAGGLLYVRGTGASGMEIVDTVMTNNTVKLSPDAALLNVAAAGGSLTVRRSVLGRSGDVASGIYKSGTSQLIVTNSLVVDQARHGVRVAAGTVHLGSCTIAGNTAWGVTNSAGTVTVKDSIVWSNAWGGVTNATATHTDSQNLLAGTGNISDDPLFVDTTYYHLQSRGGQYTNGYFTGGGWGALGANSSPCIDAGDPASPYGQEPSPNGGRINLGAYGNTPVASSSGQGIAAIMVQIL